MNYSVISKIKVSTIISPKSIVSSIKLKEQRQATPESLARLWGCGLETAKQFVKFYPMESKSYASDTLKIFHQDVGVPPTIHTDNSKELVEEDFTRLNRKVDTK